ncbi:PLP-dependent aminotransferase family protein [Aquihabitans daechungensis]|uniref:aminotransferase-like domain-containing protein n=1 Tax=Aquihabitans daechungensis TaxID=1052257 RepID=UPI003BA32917
MVKSLAVERAGSSAIRDLLEITERPGIVSLAGGLPNPATFPSEALARAAAAALAADPSSALQYGPTEGHRPLRRWIADRNHLGPAGEDRVLVTSGSQQALELATRALVDPGGLVALADPAYVGALQAFRAAGVELAAIPADGDGLRVDVLADRLAKGERPTLVYVVANFDNPSGSTLAAERRTALAELADRYGFWIIDDDPYGDLRWRGEAPVALRDLTDRTITLGSTSKVLAPGLRVGWAIAPVEVHRSLTILKQSADLHTSSLTQQIVHRTLAEDGFLDAHLATLRTTYRLQAQHLVDALRTELGDRLVVPEPDGGMFVWAELRAPGADTAALLAPAVEHGVAFVPGAAFGVEDLHPRRMRLSFATADPDALDLAVARLVGVLPAP